jgi:hypothetical protein
MKKNTVTPIRKLAPPAPEFRPRFSSEGLDSLIDILVKKTVASIRAREAAQRAHAEHDCKDYNRNDYQ